MCVSALLHLVNIPSSKEPPCLFNCNCIGPYIHCATVQCDIHEYLLQSHHTYSIWRLHIGTGTVGAEGAIAPPHFSGIHVQLYNCQNLWLGYAIPRPALFLAHVPAKDKLGWFSTPTSNYLPTPMLHALCYTSLTSPPSLLPSITCFFSSSAVHALRCNCTNPIADKCSNDNTCEVFESTLVYKVFCEVAVTVFDNETVSEVNYYCQDDRLIPICPPHPSHNDGHKGIYALWCMLTSLNQHVRVSLYCIVHYACCDDSDFCSRYINTYISVLHSMYDDVLSPQVSDT